MKLTNRQLLDSLGALRTLNSQKLPVKSAFKVAKNSRLLNDALKDYQETLKGLQDEHAKKGKDGKPKVEGETIQMKDKEAFNSAYQELLDLENDVKITPVKLKDLGKLELEPAVLMSLDWLIVE